MLFGIWSSFCCLLFSTKLTAEFGKVLYKEVVEGFLPLQEYRWDVRTSWYKLAHLKGDASYTLVSPGLSFLKGGSQVEESVRWSSVRSSLRSGSVVVPKEVACSLSKLRKRELNYLTSIWSYSLRSMKVLSSWKYKWHLWESQESTGHLHQVGLELVKS